MLQITYGLLCAPDGCPIAIEVFDGDTADPMTLATQIEKLKQRFWFDRVVMVGDRDHEIRPATPHVVAWPAAWGADGDRDEDAGLGERRHWHTACWRARHRRAPRTERSRNAPRH